MSENKRFASSTLLILAAAGMFSGCVDPEEVLIAGSDGEKKRVEFAYSGSGCFLGCPIDDALIVGASDTIAVTGAGNGAEITARSSDPAIATFTRNRQCNGDNGPCNNYFEVETFASGDAHLELIGRDGEVVDRIKIPVRRAAEASFTRNSDGSSVDPVEGRFFDVNIGESIQIEAEFRDADGRILHGPSGGAKWRTSDEAVAGLDLAFFSNAAIEVQGNAPGEATLTVDMPGLSRSVTIRVSG